MKAIVTVGLGFGDEGKGATVDFLADRLNADLVVRYSGGAQAGHNVQLPDGRRHTFSQFGSATLQRVPTYLGPRMIICPSTLKPETDHLIELGVERPLQLLTAHPSCLLSTTYHMSMNRLREIDRGANRHGSCGLGMGETRSYWLKHGLDAVVAGDWLDRYGLIAKLTVLRDRFLIEMQNLNKVDPDYANSIYHMSPHQEADSIIEMMSHVDLEHKLPRARVALFEGAQGVLLDEYFGFHPYTTWSTVTAQHAYELLETIDVKQVTTLGLTRAYSTRHGSGPFPSFCPKWTKQIHDAGNPENEWQGELQSGPLDLVLLKYALEVCPVDAIVVNNLDELPSESKICSEYESLGSLNIPRTMRDQERLTKILEVANPVFEPVTTTSLLERLEELAPIALTGHGPCRDSRRLQHSLLDSEECDLGTTLTTTNQSLVGTARLGD